jgi:hypothetical protein
MASQDVALGGSLGEQEHSPMKQKRWSVPLAEPGIVSD